MRRSILAIVTCVIFGAGMLQAQRGAGGGFGHGGFGGGHGGFGHVNGGGKGIGISGGFARNRRFGYGNGWGVWPGYYYGGYGLDWDLPYWDYVNFPPNGAPPQGYYGPEGEAAPANASRPVVVVRDRAPAPPVQSPKLIEVPLPNDSSTMKPQPPALFVLTNGEKLESRRYVLSARSLQVDIDRKQRTIPIDQLNVDATIAANQQRGIDITVPQDRNSLFLGF